MNYKPNFKIIILGIFLLFHSSCLQEASYIENNNISKKDIGFYNEKNQHKYNKFEKEDFFLSKDDKRLQEDEISWNNVFTEYYPEKENENNNLKDLNINKIDKTKNKPIQNENLQEKKKNIKEKQINQSNSTKSTQQKQIIQKNEKKLIKPINGQILSKFNKNPKEENGLSFKARSENIYASSDGRVIYVDKHGDNGKTIIIKFNNGIVGSYVFNGESLVEINTNVEKKKIIGKINMDNGKNILYFSTRENGKLNNPEQYFID
jgi:septal ring factor EnvC (AmiA/AmiB activator)